MQYAADSKQIHEIFRTLPRYGADLTFTDLPITEFISFMRRGKWHLVVIELSESARIVVTVVFPNV